MYQPLIYICIPELDFNRHQCERGLLWLEYHNGATFKNNNMHLYVCKRSRCRKKSKGLLSDEEGILLSRGIHWENSRASPSLDKTLRVCQQPLPLTPWAFCLSVIQVHAMTHPPLDALFVLVRGITNHSLVGIEGPERAESPLLAVRTIATEVCGTVLFTAIAQCVRTADIFSIGSVYPLVSLRPTKSSHPICMSTAGHSFCTSCLSPLAHSFDDH